MRRLLADLYQRILQYNQQILTYDREIEALASPAKRRGTGGEERPHDLGAAGAKGKDYRPSMAVAT